MKHGASTNAFSRERLAGYDPELLGYSEVFFGGAGALANNVLLDLALSGLGCARIADPDVCELTNATRSPLMKRARLLNGVQRFKADEAARGFVANGYAISPKAFAARERVERLGLGAFAGTSAIVTAVDRDTVRGWLSDAGMFLGIPTIEAGFDGHIGQMTVFRHDDPDGPCWRCIHPEVESGSASCSLYALAVQSEGLVPATQPVAALFGALVAHATLAVLHADFSLASTMVTFDLARGTSRRISIDRNPSCLGPHRRLANPIMLTTTSRDRIDDLFRELAVHGTGASVVLSSPFVVQLPCRSCGRAVHVGSPADDITTPPQCKNCEPEKGCDHASVPRAYATLSAGDLPRSMRLSRLSFRAGGLFEGSFDDGRAAVFQLGDDPRENFRVFENTRNTHESRDMKP